MSQGGDGFDLSGHKQQDTSILMVPSVSACQGFCASDLQQLTSSMSNDAANRRQAEAYTLRQRSKYWSRGERSSCTA